MCFRLESRLMRFVTAAIATGIPTIVRIVMVSLLGLELSVAGAAQQQDVSKDDVASMREEIKALKETQQQILQRLDELTSILKPEPPSLKTPESMNIQGDT